MGLKPTPTQGTTMTGQIDISEPLRRGGFQTRPTLVPDMTGHSHCHYEKPRRRSLRLRHYDYAGPGAYFITACTHRGAGLFGCIVGGGMRLNTFGTLVEMWPQTGRAVLPHPAFGRDHAFALGKPTAYRDR